MAHSRSTDDQDSKKVYEDSTAQRQMMISQINESMIFEMDDDFDTKERNMEVEQDAHDRFFSTLRTADNSPQK